MKKRIFKKNDTSQDIKNKLINKVIPYYSTKSEALINQGIKSFKKLENDVRTLSIIKKIDSTYCDSRQKERNIFGILYGIILLDYYKDFTDKLSDEALVLFSHNLGLFPGDFNRIDIVYDTIEPVFLEEIIAKTKDIDKRDIYFLYIDNLENCENKEYIIDRIRNMTDDELEKINYFDEEFMEEIGQLERQLKIRL